MNSEFEKDAKTPQRHLKLVPLESLSGGTCRAYTSQLAGKKIFVKEIKPEFRNDGRMATAFRKEAEIGFRLEHPNIPKYIFAEGILPSDSYIVQEFIDGQPLDRFVKANPSYFADKANLSRFITEMADVLDYLHSNQIVHLDIKPSNILITRVGHSLRLVDFGFSASDFYHDTRGHTPEFDMPESTGAESGEEKDFYSFGKILEFIRLHTPGCPKGKFLKIERGLLGTASGHRLVSKQEIMRNLRKSQYTPVWVSMAALLLVLAIPLSFLSVKTSSQAVESVRPVETVQEEALRPVEAAAEKVVTPAVSKVEVATRREQQPTPLETKEEEPKEVLQPSQEVSKPASNMPAAASVEALKAEMRKNIQKNFLPFQMKLAQYRKENRYSDKDSKELDALYRQSLRQTFATEKYKAAFKELSPSLIDDTLAEVFAQEENKNWGPSYRAYLEACKSYHSP